MDPSLAVDESEGPMRYLWCALGGMVLFVSMGFVSVVLSSTTEPRFAYSRSFAVPEGKEELVSQSDPGSGDDPMMTVVLPHLSHEMPYYALSGALFGVCVGLTGKHGRRLLVRRGLR